MPIEKKGMPDIRSGTVNLKNTRALMDFWLV
jgi:hypothetical protein